jgi:hypothetical protein
MRRKLLLDREPGDMQLVAYSRPAESSWYKIVGGWEPFLPPLCLISFEDGGADGLAE